MHLLPHFGPDLRRRNTVLLAVSQHGFCSALVWLLCIIKQLFDGRLSIREALIVLYHEACHSEKGDRCRDKLCQKIVEVLPKVVNLVLDVALRDGIRVVSKVRVENFIRLIVVGIVDCVKLIGRQTWVTPFLIWNEHLNDRQILPPSVVVVEDVVLACLTYNRTWHISQARLDSVIKECIALHSLLLSFEAL